MYGTATTSSFDPFVRVSTATGQTPDVVIVYAHVNYSEAPLPPAFVPFSKRALSAVERKQARMRAAFERRLVEQRWYRLPAIKPKSPPPARRRCCSLAGAWRTRR